MKSRIPVTLKSTAELEKLLRQVRAPEDIEAIETELRSRQGGGGAVSKDQGELDLPTD